MSELGGAERTGVGARSLQPASSKRRSTRIRRVGYDFGHAIVDDHSRLAYAERCGQPEWGLQAAEADL